MCCNEGEKLGFDLRVTQGLEGFEMPRCDVHSQRIPNLKRGNLRRETGGKPYSAISVRLTPVRGHTKRLGSVNRVSTFACGSEPSSGTPSSQAVDRSGTAPLSARGQLNNIPYILRSLKKRKCTEKSWYQYIFLRKRGWTPACPLPSEAKRPSHSPDEIEKYAFVVVLQIGQVVGEVGEVVADAGLQVLANMTIDRGQCAAAPLIYIRQVKRSYLRQAIPFLEEPPVHAQHRELRGVVEETRVHAIQTFLSHAIRVLASKGPIRREVVVHIQRRDVALLKELGRGVLQSHLTRGRQVDSDDVRESAHDHAILVTLLDVDTGSVGEPSLHARDQVALAAAKQQPVVCLLVFKRIVQVITGPLGIEKASPDLAAGSEVSVGRLPVDPEAFRQAIGAAHADAIIAFTAAACRDPVLAETIGAPGGAGIELHLRDRVRALALYLP